MLRARLKIFFNGAVRFGFNILGTCADLRKGWEADFDVFRKTKRQTVRF